MILFIPLQYGQVTDLNLKKFFNYIMLFVILGTWARLIGFFLVIQQFSKLLMTTMQMMITGSYFLTILSIYLILMSTIFMGLFQESTMSYSNFPNTIRTLFDAVLGAYVHDIAPAVK